MGSKVIVPGLLCGWTLLSGASTETSYELRLAGKVQQVVQQVQDISASGHKLSQIRKSSLDHTWSIQEESEDNLGYLSSFSYDEFSINGKNLTVVGRVNSGTLKYRINTIDRSIAIPDAKIVGYLGLLNEIARLPEGGAATFSVIGFRNGCVTIDSVEAKCEIGSRQRKIRSSDRWADIELNEHNELIGMSQSTLKGELRLVKIEANASATPSPEELNSRIQLIIANDDDSGRLIQIANTSEVAEDPFQQRDIAGVHISNVPRGNFLNLQQKIAFASEKEIDEMITKTLALYEGDMSTAERIRKLCWWLQWRISGEGPHLLASNPLECLRTGIGDCKDRAMVLAEFFRRLRIPSIVELGLVRGPGGDWLSHCWTCYLDPESGHWVHADPSMPLKNRKEYLALVLVRDDWKKSVTDLADLVDRLRKTEGARSK